MRKIWIAALLLGISASVPAQNPLAGLPSSPGSHVAQIQALGDNEWLSLGTPAADPTWGKARAKSWSGYMAYAQDLQGAFFAGQSTHGYIRPDGRYDDIFFYDVNANKWVCVFPGVNTTTFVADINAGNLKMRDDGQLIDRDGQPVMLAYTGHGYKAYTYAADLHRWVTVVNAGGIGGDQYSNAMQWYIDGKALLQAQMAGKTDSVSGRPFFYNTVSGQFERYHFNTIETSGMAAVVYYLSSKQKLWHYFGQGSKRTSLGDFTSHQWSNAGATGSAPPGIDFGGCYDSKRDCIYLGAGQGYGGEADSDKVFKYDVAANAWSSPPNAGAQTFGHSHYTIVNYDAAGDRVLNLDHNWSTRTATIRIFNPGTWSWDETLPVPAGVHAAECWSGFYSPELNAHFFYIAFDSYDNGIMWVYRYKRAASSINRAAARSVMAFSAYPNPFRSSVTLNLGQVKTINSLDIFDTRGRNVKSVQRPVNGQFVWDSDGLPSGIYTVRVKTAKGILVKNVLMQK